VIQALEPLPVGGERAHGLHERRPFGIPEHRVDVVFQPETNIVPAHNLCSLNSRLQTIGERKRPDGKEPIAQLKDLEESS
jgi:hypothetical protein